MMYRVPPVCEKHIAQASKKNARSTTRNLLNPFVHNFSSRKSIQIKNKLKPSIRDSMREAERTDPSPPVSYYGDDEDCARAFFHAFLDIQQPQERERRRKNKCDYAWTHSLLLPSSITVTIFSLDSQPACSLSSKKKNKSFTFF